MAVICRISGFWSFKAVLLVSLSLAVPCTEILTSKRMRMPQMKWAGSEFLLISALVLSVAWKKKGKKIFFFFCFHICPDIPGSCLLPQPLHITSAHCCFHAGSWTGLHWEILVFLRDFSSQFVSNMNWDREKSNPSEWGDPELEQHQTSWQGQWWFSSTRPGAAFWWSFN